MLSVEKVLLELSKTKFSTRKKIMDATGIDQNSIGYHLKKLMNKGFVTKLDHGSYKVTEKGLVHVDELNERYYQESSSHRENKIGQSTGILEKDIIETAASWKRRYGKDGLIKILDNIKSLIE